MHGFVKLNRFLEPGDMIFVELSTVVSLFLINGASKLRTGVIEDNSWYPKQHLTCNLVCRCRISEARKISKEKKCGRSPAMTLFKHRLLNNFSSPNKCGPL